MSEIQGVHIKEVWEQRLSSAIPQIVRNTGTWVVQIWAKSNPDYVPEHTICDFDDDGVAIAGTSHKVPATGIAVPLEEYDTGIPWKKGDAYDTEKLKACFEWLLTVRDKYSLPNIEELKPEVAELNRLFAIFAEMERDLSPAMAKLERAKLDVWAEALAAQKTGGA